MRINSNDATNRAISITKLLSANVERVWQAWTQPEQITQWWGPDGFPAPLVKWM